MSVTNIAIYNTYMFLNKCRQHTVQVTSLSAFAGHTHSMRSPQFTSYLWKLFHNPYIL